MLHMKRLPYRWILPVAQLALSVGILWPVKHEVDRQIRDAGRFRRITVEREPTIGEVLAVVVPQRETEKEKSEFNRFEVRKWIPSVLNLPAGLVQLPYVILSASKEEWVPVGLDVMTWRAVSWPLVGVLLWWSVGRGIEASIAARNKIIEPKISWTETTIALAVFLFCGVAAIFFPIFGQDPHDPEFPQMLFSAGFAVWTLLAGVVLLAKFCQRHILRNPMFTQPTQHNC